MANSRVPKEQQKSGCCASIIKSIKKSAGLVAQLVSPAADVCTRNGCADASYPTPQGIVTQDKPAKFTNSSFFPDNPVSESILESALKNVFGDQKNLVKNSASLSFLSAIPEECITKLLQSMGCGKSSIFCVNQLIKGLGLLHWFDMSPTRTVLAPVGVFTFTKLVGYFTGHEHEKQAGHLAVAIAISAMIYLYGPTAVGLGLVSGGIGHYYGKLLTKDTLQISSTLWQKMAAAVGGEEVHSAAQLRR